jgi:hypothetical protein
MDLVNISAGKTSAREDKTTAIQLWKTKDPLKNSRNPL